LFSPAGQKIGSEFLVNQFTNYNQRTPAVAALAGGGFVVTWVSEQQRTAAPQLGNNTTYATVAGMIRPSVDICARLYSGSGVPVGNEFLVNSNSSPCANPAVAAGSDGGFMVVWGARDLVNIYNGWDICARSFSSASANAGGPIVTVNTSLYGDQYAPRINSIGTDYLVVWTSLGQDGSREGVYGQFVHAGGTPVGGEFRVNTTTAGPQMQPAIASDGASQFVVVWTDYNGLPNGFDLFAQRFVNVGTTSNLPPMAAPFVLRPFVLSSGVYQPQLQVTWPFVQGMAVASYQVYVNGAAMGTNLPTVNLWTMTAANGLKPNSTNWFQVAYTRNDGLQSPLSAATTNSTWSKYNWGGIPDDWMIKYFGTDTSKWPSANAPVVPGGLTYLQIFLSGGDPGNPATWLQQTLVQTPQGMFLNWNTQPGHTYQLLVQTNLGAAWSNLGAPRFAAGTNDSVYVGGGSAGYYQVLFLY
jgi:hypothetical protein